MKKNCSIVYTYKSDKTTPERDSNLKNSLENIHKIVHPNNVIIVNFGNDNPDWKNISNNFRIVDTDNNYSRGLGNNIGFNYVDTEYVFFLDIDMIVKEEFFNDIVLKRGTCYFPICYSIYKDKPNIVGENNGWWRESGYGMSIFHRNDFKDIGRFIHNNTWGGEDVTLYNRAVSLHRIRKRNKNLIHQWHPDGQDFKSRFYEYLPY